MSFRVSLTIVTLAAILTAFTTTANAGTGKRGEPAEKSAELVRLVYPVADLVVPIPDSWPIEQQRPPAETKERQLMELIRGTVAPKTWKDSGGAGTLQYYPLGMALVVEQTQEAQEEIRDLLNALRRLQEVEVAVELRMVSMSCEQAAEFRAKGGFAQQKADNAEAAQLAQLTDKELYLWLRVFQSDSNTDIMQAPKVTIFNGQHAGMMVGQKQPFVTEYRVVREKDQVEVKPHVETVDLGLRCGLLPTVSADRRSVQLKIDFRHTALDGPVAEMPVVVRAGRKGGSEAEIQAGLQQARLLTLKFQQTCCIPDGNTMAVSVGQVMVDARNESGPPVLKDIPYLNRLFRNVGWAREARAVFLFITPRVIVTEAEEQPVLSELPSVPRP